MKFPLVIRRGKTQLIGQLKEILGVLTQGQTVEEEKENIQDALALHLEDMREDDSENDDAIITRRSEICLALMKRGKFIKHLEVNNCPLHRYGSRPDIYK